MPLLGTRHLLRSSFSYLLKPSRSFPPARTLSHNGSVTNMSSEAFGETLQFITNVKLQELEKKKQKFHEHRAKVQAEAINKRDQVDRLSVLVEGMKDWPGSASADFDVDNMERWIEQARRQPGFPEPVLVEWIRSAEALLDHEGTRYEFAELFGRLLKDWLQSSAHARAYAGVSLDNEVVPEASLNDTFETLSRKETLEQKEKLESLIFKPKEVDVAQLEHYLNELFSASKDATEALKVIRERIDKFAENFRKETITASTLGPIISSVLALDVLSDQKKATLKMFKGNPSIVAELASVLNMQLTSLQSWSWPEKGVMLEPLRHLNGKTRFYLDAEILTCLLLHYIGISWAAEFKSALQDLRMSKAWKKMSKTLSKKEYHRRAVFFKPVLDNDSVNHKLREFQGDHFFMCQLPSSIYSQVDNYREEPSSEESGDLGPKFNDPVNLKQSLLHIICSDILLKKTLYGQCHVVRTDLEWFGPSLPFQTILTVLKFFGMPAAELKFMQSFLSCPIYFKDDPSDIIRTRQRGVPISYMLSTLAGELTMFVMDFAVNQKADGLFLHRIHDDFWFWDSKPERCVAAWQEMNKYARLAGLTFNAEKTGYVAVGKNAKSLRELPHGDVRWGFLLMDQNGRFVIDKELVGQHIVEFGRQLDATTSLFGWTQAYNKYMLFIIRNCGEPAFIYGQAHIDEIISTIAEIQKRLFPKDGKFIDKLAELFLKKFGVTKEEIPMGWYLWPNAAGGLEIVDPFVNPFLVRDSFEEDKKDKKNTPEEIIAEALKEDERQYNDAKERWEVGREMRVQNNLLERGTISSSDPFFSLEEFQRGSDDGASWWLEAFEKLLRRPVKKGIKSTPRLEASVQLLGEGIQAFGASSTFASSWSRLSPYWQWVISVHHDEMVKKFGSLAIVDPESVPVGMVSVFKSTRMRWEQ